MKGERNAPTGAHATRERHQTLTIALHWITVLLVVTQFTLAILHDQVSDAEARRSVLTAHRSVGILIGLLVVGRLAWRLLGMRLPPFPASMTQWHQRGARLSEWGLYGLLLAQPATGLAASILKGRPFNLFGIPIPALVAANKGWAADAATLHTLGGFALVGLVLIHASAAILHRVIANDGVLDSMLPIMQRKSTRHDQ